MKIILEAFGKLQSKPMDIPENTGPYFKLVLSQPLTAISGYNGDKIGEIKPLQTLAEFEWTGKLYALDGFESARIYILRDIIKN